MINKTLTHPKRGPAEYTLAVVCDDPGHDPADVELVGYWPRPVYPPGQRGFGFLCWLSAGDTLQTTWGEDKRLADLGIRGQANHRVAGMTGPTKWRFACPACRRTEPIVGRKAEQIFERLREHAVPMITLGSLVDLAARIR